MQEPGCGRRRDPGDDGQHLAGEAAHGGEQGGDHDDAEDDEIEDGNGHGAEPNARNRTWTPRIAKSDRREACIASTDAPASPFAAGKRAVFRRGRLAGDARHEIGDVPDGRRPQAAAAPPCRRAACGATAVGKPELRRFLQPRRRLRDRADGARKARARRNRPYRAAAARRRGTTRGPPLRRGRPPAR